MERHRGAPGSHPVWTCQSQEQEKTVALMDLESSPCGCPSLSFTFSKKKGMKRVKEGLMTVFEERQTHWVRAQQQDHATDAQPSKI